MKSRGSSSFSLTGSPPRDGSQPGQDGCTVSSARTANVAEPSVNSPTLRSTVSNAASARPPSRSAGRPICTSPPKPSARMPTPATVAVPVEIVVMALPSGSPGQKSWHPWATAWSRQLTAYTAGHSERRASRTDGGRPARRARTRRGWRTARRPRTTRSSGGERHDGGADDAEPVDDGHASRSAPRGHPGRPRPRTAATTTSNGGLPRDRRRHLTAGEAQGLEHRQLPALAADEQDERMGHAACGQDHDDGR